MSIRKFVEKVGQYISDHSDNTIPSTTLVAKELIIQVDGGHVKSREVGSRSFEALTAVVYKPESIIPGKKKRTSGTLTQKHCAASALDDGGNHINTLTLVAAKKGLASITQVTGLCDGADNCWKIADSIKPHCKHVESLLDWFHIRKIFQNTRMGSTTTCHWLKRNGHCGMVTLKHH